MFTQYRYLIIKAKNQWTAARIKRRFCQRMPSSWWTRNLSQLIGMRAPKPSSIDNFVIISELACIFAPPRTRQKVGLAGGNFALAHRGTRCFRIFIFTCPRSRKSPPTRPCSADNDRWSMKSYYMRTAWLFSACSRFRKAISFIFSVAGSRRNPRNEATAESLKNDDKVLIPKLSRFRKQPVHWHGDCNCFCNRSRFD